MVPSTGAVVRVPRVHGGRGPVGRGLRAGGAAQQLPAVPRENDIDQLGLVIRHLGTPTEEVWPGVGLLPDYSKITFPDCTGVTYEQMVPEAPETAVHLVSQFIVYNSDVRMSAEKAVKHEYFYEKPFPSTPDQMRKPAEKKMDKGSFEFDIQLPFHLHFEKLLNLV